jgi:hypothetical protein
MGSLLGRVRECAELDRLLADVTDGASRVLVLRGDAGTGKSALLDYLSDQVGGGDFVSTWRTLEEFAADGRARSIGLSNFPGSAPAAARQRDRHRPVGQPGRGAPVLYERRGPELLQAERHHVRVVVTARSRQGPRRPRDRTHRRGDGKVGGSGRAAVAPSARGRRLPEVRYTATHRGELHGARLPAGRCRHGGNRRARRGEAGRVGSHPDTFDFIGDRSAG